MHHETIAWQGTAIGATVAALTAVAGDSPTVRAARAGSKIRITGLWVDQQVAGSAQIVAPSFNDTTRGYRLATGIAQPRNRFPLESVQLLMPQELIVASMAGSAVAGDIESLCLSIWYEDVPGLSGRFIMPAELEARAIRAVTVTATLATGTAGGWSGAEAITAESDLLRANTDYAVLGIETTVEAAAIGIRAPDWGNVRCGVPGDPLWNYEAGSWFVTQSKRTGLPHIPVFNSGNKNAVMLDALQDENGADPIVTVHLVELKA